MVIYVIFKVNNHFKQTQIMLSFGFTPPGGENRVMDTHGRIRKQSP